MGKANIRTLYVVDRRDWRAWLEENFETAGEIWLEFPKKASGRPRISYNDAVEEALCFGWIDSKVISLGEDSTAQRFTPRSPKSGYSQQNRERLRWLREQGMLLPSVESTVEDVLAEEFVFPEDIIDAIKQDEEAWRNYQGFSEPYKRIRIAYIDSSRKRPEEFERRLNNFIARSREGKLIGYGGIEKYY